MTESRLIQSASSVCRVDYLRKGTDFIDKVLQPSNYVQGLQQPLADGSLRGGDECVGHEVAELAGGAVLMEQGAYQEAIPRFQRALELSPELIYRHSHLALAYLNVEDYSQAAEEFQFLSKVSPEDPAAWYQLARAEALAGNRDKAAHLLRRSLALGGDEYRKKSEQDTVLQNIERRIK